VAVMSAMMLPVADAAAVRVYAVDISRRYRRQLVGVVGLASLATVAGLFGPRLLGEIVQDVQQGTTSGHIDVLAGLLVVAICVQALLSRYAYLAGKVFGETVLAELRQNFVDSVLDLPLSKVEQAGSGDLINRASRDVGRCGSRRSRGFRPCSARPVPRCSRLWPSSLVSPMLAAVTLMTMPPMVLIARWYLRYARNGYLATNATYSTMIENLAGTVEGARAVEALRLGQAAH
jgi:ABC-type multidrug transport system fused ATPase/permease subunit